jgi:hypothetical protein
MKRFLMLVVFVFWAVPALAQIASTSPACNELNVPVDSDISVTFSIGMDSTTIDNSSFIVNARSTGLHQGTVHYDTLNDSLIKMATLDPSVDFEEGEVVTVVLTTDIKSHGGTPLSKSYIWSFTVVAGNGTGAFSSHSEYSVGSSPIWVIAADLDGDGDFDLATANGTSNNVSVLKNHGDGTFAAHSTYSTGTISLPTAIFAADLDGDGDLDLVTGNIDADSVSVLLNNGGGTFTSRSDYAIGDQPYSAFGADLDGDGDIDLTTANYSGNNVSVLLNNGNGTFGSHSSYSAGTLPHSVFAADLDGDGDLDLATANFGFYTGEVSVLLNNGAGTFPSHSEYPVDVLPQTVFAADLDGDGDLDLTTTNLGGYNVSVLLNNGDGTFATHSAYSLTDQSPNSVFAADFDGDGDLDLATANQSDNNVSVLLQASTDVEDEGILSHLPEIVSLKQNHPNPFNPTTVIHYTVGSPQSAVRRPVYTTLKIYNVLGQLVKILVDGEKTAGNYNIFWDGKDSFGNEVASGIYFYQLRTEDFTDTKKMLLLR